MKNRISQELLNTLMDRAVQKKHVHGAVFHVEDTDGSLSLLSSKGNMQADDRYFIASVTKLYVTAVLLVFREQKRLNLDDPMIQFFPAGLVEKIHVLDGVDYTGKITVRHLMANTSGLPDYFSGRVDGHRPQEDLFGGRDEAWPLEKILKRVRLMRPDFKPGEKRKVRYSDTNYELLGGIIESIAGKPIAEVFREVLFEPLKLQETYAFQDETDTKPVPMYYRSNPIHVPKYIASVTAEGGLVSTARETMTFLKAFFGGTFFPVEQLDELKQWRFNRSPGQFYFGVGLEKLWVPRLLIPGPAVGEILGFWGHSGAFAFHHPASGLYFTGTGNQINGHGHAAMFRMMIRLVRQAQKGA